jgi:hypothetical protein
MHRILAVSAALLVTACTHGPRLDRLAFPTRPEGAQAAVATNRATYTGELISAADTGFVVLMTTGNRLVFVPASITRQISVQSIGVVRMPLRGRALERVRLVSRHPYGIPAPARSELLRVTGQDDLERIEP